MRSNVINPKKRQVREMMLIKNYEKLTGNSKLATDEYFMTMCNEVTAGDENGEYAQLLAGFLQSHQYMGFDTKKKFIDKAKIMFPGSIFEENRIEVAPKLANERKHKIGLANLDTCSYPMTGIDMAKEFIDNLDKQTPIIVLTTLMTHTRWKGRTGGNGLTKPQDMSPQETFAWMVNYFNGYAGWQFENEFLCYISPVRKTKMIVVTLRKK